MESRNGLVQYIARHDRARVTLMVVLLALAGVLEGFGIVAALPVLESMVSADAGTESGLSLAIEQGLRTVGLEPSTGLLLTLLVVMFTLKGVVFYLAVLTVGTVVARVAMELRIRLLRAISSAEWRHVLRYPSGFISNAVSNEVGRTGMAYQEFAQVVAEGTQVIVYLAIVFLMSWETGVAAIGAGAVILLILQGRVMASRRAGHDQVQILRSILARLTDALPSLKPLKAMGMEGYLLPRLEEETEAFFIAQRKEIASTELLKKAREPLLMAALAFGLWFVLTFTTLAATSIMILAGLFYRTVTSITNMQQRWVSVLIGDSSFRSLMEHIEAAETARETWAEDGKPPPRFEEELRVEDLSFSFGDTAVLKGANATLRAGRFVAVVGPSGSGKTTLTDLLTGLLRPAGGRILVDGVSLAEAGVRGWRRQIGYVPQEPMLFSDTVRANVTLGNPAFGDNEVEAALRAASAWDFVMALDGGLNHRIGEEGTTLSGGQRQRLAIARALVTRPSLLILDEPTTALDTVSEQEVCRAIARLKGKLSILSISHQPALRELADEVWDVRDGKIHILVAGAAGGKV
ncbi:MAG: ABC transporter ATP-binding protein [Gemmatimonadota bacterium]